MHTLIANDTMLVVIIDDDIIGAHLLSEVMEDFTNSQREVFSDPAEAAVWMARETPDLVITDYEMPRMNGLEVVKMLRAQEHTKDIPILMLTGVEEPALRLEALNAGTNDFIRKPFDTEEIKSRVRNMLALRQGQLAQQHRADALSLEVERAVAEIRERERETILRLSRAAEYRDSDTHAHLQRIADYVALIAAGLGWEAESVEALALASPMHDVGKIGIPDDIMLKPGRLEPHEYEIMKTHTTIGHKILVGSRSPLLETAAEIALSHHEHWDGNGYPNGIAGEQIPLTGRIVAVADVFDALTTKRTYKPAWDIQDALDYIKERADSQFDPDCARVFLEQAAEVRVICEQLAD